MKGINIAEQAHVVNALPPIDIGGAAKTSDYFCLKNYRHASIIVTFGVITNAPTITLYESDDNAGSTETAIGFSYYLEATTAGDTLATKATATTAGVTFSTDNAQTMVIEIDAADLTDGYPYLVVKTDNPAACLSSVVAVLSGARYGGATTPTAIT